MFVLLGFCCIRSLEWRGAVGILSEDFLGVCLSGIKILMLIESKSINFASQVKAKSFRTVLQTIASCTATELRFPIFHKILKKSHFQRKFSPLTNLQVFQVIAFRFDFWWLGLLFVCLFVYLIGRSLKHVKSGKCVHPTGYWPGNGRHLVIWSGCDQHRLQLWFGKQGTPFNDNNNDNNNNNSNYKNNILAGSPLHRKVLFSGAPYILQLTSIK